MQAVLEQRPLVQLFSLLTLEPPTAERARQELLGRLDDIGKYIREKGVHENLRSPFDLPDHIVRIGPPLVPVLVEWLCEPGREGACRLGILQTIKFLSEIADQEPSAVKPYAAPIGDFLDRFVRQNYMHAYSFVYNSPEQAAPIGRLLGRLIEDRVGFVRNRIDLLLEGNSHSSKGEPHPGQLGQAAALLAVVENDRTPECSALLKEIILRGSDHSPLIPYAFPQYVLHSTADWAPMIDGPNLNAFPRAILQGVEAAIFDQKTIDALDESHRAIVTQTLAKAALHEPYGGSHRIRALRALAEIDRNLSKTVREQILAQAYRNNPSEVEYIYMTYREVQPYCLYTLLGDALPEQYEGIMRNALSRGPESRTAKLCFALFSGKGKPLQTPASVWNPNLKQWESLVVAPPPISLDAEDGAGRISDELKRRLGGLIADCIKAGYSDPPPHDGLDALLKLSATEALRGLAKSHYFSLVSAVLERSGGFMRDLFEEYKNGLTSDHEQVRSSAVRALCRNGTNEALSLLDQFGGKAMLEVFGTGGYGNSIEELAAKDRNAVLGLLRTAIEKGGASATSEMRFTLDAAARLYREFLDKT